MENQTSEKKIKRVEELEHFPFKNFDEFKKQITEGLANITVDRSVALNWVQNGIYSSAWQRWYALFLASFTFTVPIGFIAYTVITKTWILLLALPLLLVGFLIFHPNQAMMLGKIRSGLILLTFGGLVWGLVSGIGWLTALNLSLVILWYVQRAIYNKAVNGMIRAVMQHEDLLCILWNSHALNVYMQNGDSYRLRNKVEAGETIRYNN